MASPDRFHARREKAARVALEKIKGYVSNKGGEVSGFDLQKKFASWRKQPMRLWLLDKMRTSGMDFEVTQFYNTDHAIMRVFIVEDSNDGTN